MGRTSCSTRTAPEPTAEDCGIPELLGELVSRDGPESIAGFLRAYAGMNDAKQEDLWTAIQRIQNGTTRNCIATPEQISRTLDEFSASFLLAVGGMDNSQLEDLREAFQGIQDGKRVLLASNTDGGADIGDRYNALPKREQEEIYNAITDAERRAHDSECDDDGAHERYHALLTFADWIDHMRTDPSDDHGATENLLHLYDFTRDQGRRLAEAWGIVWGVLQEKEARCLLLHRRERHDSES